MWRRSGVDPRAFQWSTAQCGSRALRPLLHHSSSLLLPHPFLLLPPIYVFLVALYPPHHHRYKQLYTEKRKRVAPVCEDRNWSRTTAYSLSRGTIRDADDEEKDYNYYYYCYSLPASWKKTSLASPDPIALIYSPALVCPTHLLS